MTDFHATMPAQGSDSSQVCISTSFHRSHFSPSRPWETTDPSRRGSPVPVPNPTAMLRRCPPWHSTARAVPSPQSHPTGEEHFRNISARTETCTGLQQVLHHPSITPLFLGYSGREPAARLVHASLQNIGSCRGAETHFKHQAPENLRDPTPTA